jgi:hypothetical protein
MKYLPNTNILCLEYDELVPEIMTIDQYKKSQASGKLKVKVRGGNGNKALIEYESLHDRWKRLVDKRYAAFGGVRKYMLSQPILNLIIPNAQARQFFAAHTLPSGAHLPIEYQQRYTRQAEWLGMINDALEDKRTLKDILKCDVTTFWEHVLKLHQIDQPINPALPVSYDNLRKKLKAYTANGYAALVSAKFGNQNTRKVNAKIENLILSLYCMDTKPYLVEVCRKYKDFMCGKLKVVDMVTGEVFDTKDFYVAGKPYALGESTVDYYIKKPVNIAAIDKQRMSGIQWRSKYHPHVIRKSPAYAFSKVTMDDVDIPFKDESGGRPVKSYQVYDVASGAIVGKAFGREKNVGLLREALRDMYQLILSNDWGMPLEIEMERHLTKHLGASPRPSPKEREMLRKKSTGAECEAITADILTEANIFKYVRVCLGGNAREKRAEHFIRRKKYEFQNKRPGFQGRFYARLITNRLNQDDNRVRYAYEQIVQNELDDMEAYNNSLHPKQEQYPGMTRWDVLQQCMNPEATKYPVHTVIQYVGYKAETSVRAAYVEVQYNKYRFTDVANMEQLIHPNVTAYYMPGNDGIEKVYIFQDGKYIGEALRVAPFQEARAEQTAADLANAKEQWGYQKSFDVLVRRKREQLSKVGVTSLSPALSQGEGESLSPTLSRGEGDVAQLSYEMEPVWELGIDAIGDI